MGTNRTKSVEQAIRDTEEPEFRLTKALGPVNLTVMGIGVLIGTGIFVLAGQAAGNYSGPAVSLSFAIGGVVCALAALCYAEFASTVPVAGRVRHLPGHPDRAHRGDHDVDARPDPRGVRDEP